MAVAAGLDGATFKSCLDSQKYASQVNQSQAEGTQRGVKATPSFFVNGQIHEGGVSYPQLTALIDAALRSKGIGWRLLRNEPVFPQGAVIRANDRTLRTFYPSPAGAGRADQEPLTYLSKKAMVRCMARLKLALMLWLSPG